VDKAGLKPLDNLAVGNLPFAAQAIPIPGTGTAPVTDSLLPGCKPRRTRPATSCPQKSGCLRLY